MATLPVYSNRRPHPACDFCYARKVKCDRNEPCANCVDSNASCVRTRPKRGARPQQGPQIGGGMEFLFNRLSRLESSVTRLVAFLPMSEAIQNGDLDDSPAEQHNATVAKSTSAFRFRDSPSPAGEDMSFEKECGSRPAKRARFIGPESSASNDQPKHETNGLPAEDEFPTVSDGSTPDLAATECEAQEFIKGTLSEKSQNISIDRRSVLEAALDFIGQMETPAKRTNTEGSTHSLSIAECLIPPEPDFFQMSLSETYRTYPRVFDLEYSTYISQETLERMAVTMYKNDEDEQTLLQYSICVNAYASTFLWSSQQGKENTALQEASERSRENYSRRCFAALSRIHMLEKPSLSLVQALLSGAFLAQRLGDTSKCWMLASNACRICVALGLPRSWIFRLPHDQLSNEQKEIKACFMWCYVFDKGLAMNLGRPVCMPVWNFAADVIAPIEPKRPITAFMHVLFRWAQIQARVVCDLCYQSIQMADGAQQKESTVVSLKRQMGNIRKDIIEIRDSPPHASDPVLISQWIALDFVHHSIMTVILRFDTSSALDAGKREECLGHARAAFIALRDLKCHVHSRLQNKTLAPFLPWTVLYYPLRPYFVLFCNVVANSDASDFELMEEFVKTLVEASNPTSSAKRLQKLCGALVRLCRPLVHRAAEQRVPDTATRNETTANRTTNKKTSQEPQRHQGMFRDGDIGEDGTGVSSPNRTGTWLQQILHDDIATATANRASITFGDTNGTGTNLEDDMFNALFDVQPSLDWLGSGLFDEGSGSWGFGGSFDMP